MNVQEGARKREQSLARFIPYSNLVTESIAKTHDGNFVATLRLEGVPYESANTENLNAWKQQTNSLLRNIASPHVAIWSHIVRRRFQGYPNGEFTSQFADRLNDKYKDAVLDKAMFVNELYLSIIYKPISNRGSSILAKIRPKPAREKREEQEDAIDTLEELVATCLTSLYRYHPTLLACYELNEQVFSEQLEFYAYLLNGEQHRIPVGRHDISEILASTRSFFGKGGTMAFQTSEGRGCQAAVLAIQEYPAQTHAGILDDLLAMPFELIVTQSFTFMTKQVGLGKMKRQQGRLVAAGDVAASQVADISEAMDDLTSNRFVLGAHHFSILLKEGTSKALLAAVTIAGAALSDTGIRWVKEDLSAASATLAQLPGNFKYRPRVSDITSLNFAAFSGFHSFPVGRPQGNQWGDAVMMFRTTSLGPYFFNFHSTEAEVGGTIDKNHRDLANTMVIGQSGGGKTVLEMMMLAQASKFNQPPNHPATFILFDKDLGASIGVRAMGGKYYPIRNGFPTGFSPMQMEETELNITFLEHLVRKLVQRDDFLLTPEDEREIFEAVTGVMKLPKPQRRFGALLQFLPPTDANGIRARLARWCGDGALGWLFDNPEDKFTLDDGDIFAFDVTEFLENDETRTPVIMYLFHKIEQLIDGRRLIIFMDEFWKLLQDPYFEDLVENKLKTIRKQNGFLVCFTQSPRDALRSKISHSLIEQTATKIFLPNPTADAKDYIEGFKITQREYEIIKNLDDKSRRFLIKQGQKSVLAELDLRGFDDELAVLSGNTATSQLAEDLVAELGDDPKIWLPEFHRQRKEVL